METFAELSSSLVEVNWVSHAFVRALDEADSVVLFQDLWVRDTFKESVGHFFFKNDQNSF